MSTRDLGAMVADAQARSAAERELVSIRSRLADVDDELQALSNMPNPRRWWRRGKARETSLDQRRAELAAARTDLSERARRCSKEASGAEGARVAVGAELARREEAWRAAGNDTGSLDRLSTARDETLTRLRSVADAHDRAIEARGIAERTRYFEETEGIGGATMVFTGVTPPVRLDHGLGTPRALVGEAVLQERLAALIAVLDPLGIDGVRGVVSGPATSANLNTWLHSVERTLATTLDTLGAADQDLRGELAELDEQRIAMLDES